MIATRDTRLGVIELRRYTLRPGRRDALIELFDRQFIETQEAVGISVIGQFRDLDHPDTFTWLRGFTDMEERRGALGAFYGGPVWAQHRVAANDTMIDSDDVLLLTPSVSNGAARSVDRRSLHPAVAVGPRPFRILTFHLSHSVGADDVATLADRLASFADWEVVLLLESLYAINNFPALPVRTGEHVVVAVLGAAVCDPADPDWLSVGSDLSADLVGSEVFRLEPTGGSRLR